MRAYRDKLAPALSARGAAVHRLDSSQRRTARLRRLLVAVAVRLATDAQVDMTLTRAVLCAARRGPSQEDVAESILNSPEFRLPHEWDDDLPAADAELSQEQAPMEVHVPEPAVVAAEAAVARDNVEVCPPLSHSPCYFSA